MRRRSKVRSYALSGRGAVPLVLAWLASACCDVSSIRTQSLPDGVVGIPYGTTLSHNCSGRSTWNDAFWTATDPLPPGINLSRDGRLSGTPQVAGPYSFTVELSEEPGEYSYGGVVDTKEFTLLVRVGTAGATQSVGAIVVSVCEAAEQRDAADEGRVSRVGAPWSARSS